MIDVVKYRAESIGCACGECGPMWLIVNSCELALPCIVSTEAAAMAVSLLNDDRITPIELMSLWDNSDNSAEVAH